MVYDVIIIGAGPCGLAAGIEAHKQGLQYVILEKGTVVESVRRYPKHMTFFSTSENIAIGDVPFPTVGAKASRDEALQYYNAVVNYYRLSVRLREPVKEIVRVQADHYQLVSEKESYEAKNIVLATGYFDFPRKLHIPGENLPQVKNYYDEPYLYSFSKVAIIGAGNSAIGAALELYRNHVDVTIIHRGAEFKPTAKYWLLPDIKNRIKEGKIAALFETKVKQIEPGKVLCETSAGEEIIVEADHVLKLVGYLPDEGLFKNIGIQYDEHLIPKYDPKTYESNVEGVFLAGTVIAGSKTETVFIENGRLHAAPIMQEIASRIHTNA